MARRPGSAYNPLFIAGGPGLGKTHLLQATAAYLARHRSGPEPILVQGAAFAAEFRLHLHRGTLGAFRRRYRRAGALLLDGVAVLAGRGAAAEELARILDALDEANRQIVVADEWPPSRMPALPARLAARLGRSLVVTLHRPDEAARLALLRPMAASWGIPLGDPVLVALARPTADSIRDLEAMLARLAVEAAQGRAITPALAAAVAREITRRARRARGQVRAQAVLRAVCDYYGLPRTVLRYRGRDMPVAQARHAAMYLLREDAGLTTGQVGRALQRDHATVLHGYDRVARALAADDPVFTTVLTDIRRGVLRRRCP